MSNIILATLWFAGMAGAQTESIDCGELQLGFDGTTGQWTWLSTAGGANLLGGNQPDLEVSLDGAKWPESWAAEAPVVAGPPDGRSITVTRRAGDWTAVMAYGVSGTTVRRSVRLIYSGTEAVKVRGADLCVPEIALPGAPDAVWSLPGNYPVAEHPLSANHPGRRTRERGWTWSDTGMAYVRSETAGLSVLVCDSLQLDSATVSVQEAEGAVSLIHGFGVLAMLQTGDEIEVGSQLVRVAGGTRESLQVAGPELAYAAHPGPPADRPEWLAGAVLSELHPWGGLWAWGAGDRGNRMPSIEAQLPYLKGLGIDAIWLLPVSEKPPWVYHLPAFRHIDEQVTTADQLKSFISTGHSLGMRVLMDLVTYGVSPDSPDVASLPETVWCVDAEGQRTRAWGGSVLAADCSEPDWQAHILDLTSWWVQEFGADGFRLDCGGCGQAPNHRPRTSLHANAGMLAGGVEQNRLIRQAIRKINPDAVLLPEAGSPAFFTCGDMVFDYPLYMVCREMTREPNRAQWVSQLRDFLAAQQITHAPGAVQALVRFTENHDTVAAPEFFGVGPSQALTALQAFLPGVLLLYQEQEIGMGPELRAWLKLRHELPELRSGAADYESVTCDDPCVLAFTRALQDEVTIVAVNFGDATSACTLGVPPELTRRLPVVQDAAGGFVNPAEPLAIPPYRPLLLTVRGERRAPAQTPAAASAERRLGVQKTSEDLPEGGVRHTLLPGPATRWFLRTSEGLAVDEFVDRHRSVRAGESPVDATLPLAHLWRPVESGLWDGPGEKSLGTIAADGSMVEVSFGDVAALRRVRIEDASTTGEAVALVVDSSRGRPFEIRHHADGERRLSELARLPFAASSAGVQVDPLWVLFRNEHYSVVFSRRHGGVIHGLFRAGDDRSLVRPGAEVYTDWGLYEKGRHVSGDWETNPRLSVEEANGRTRVTFRGRLRVPSWNGVQTGPPAGPAVDFRLSYGMDDTPTMGVTFGATAATDRPDTGAFLAYRLPLALVDEWQVTGGAETVAGRTGERPGERVFQAMGTQDMGALRLRLSGSAGDTLMGKIHGEPTAPDNPFLLDEGPGSIQWFFALLAGTRTDLAAGRELWGHFEWSVD